MPSPLKLYVNKALAAPGMSHLPLLYPFWGRIQKDTVLYMVSATEQHGYDATCFTFVEDSADAEYVLIPHDYFLLRSRRPDLLARMIEEAQTAGKPILIDASSDHAGVVSVPNAVVLRINQYRFELPPYEITVPVACEDLLEQYGNGTLQIREKQERASVGFVGWANMKLVQRIRSLTKELPVRCMSLFDARQAAKIKGVFWRERANPLFVRSARVDAHFIIRSSYSGHTGTVEGDAKKNRQEFIDNLLANDYALIIRGDANAATRFYEALSLGRIPVIIDTAMVFPLEDRITYQEFCLIIPHQEFERAPDILADFHASLSPEAFIAMQRKAREVFEQYLRFDSFSPYLVDMLRSRL